MYKILVTNDDGIFGFGIEPLVRAIKDLGQVITVVPDRERSALSNSLTLKDPVRAWKLLSFPMGNGTGISSTKEKFNTYILTGTPADCVRFGIINLFKNRVDLVVSGINSGANLGQDVYYSGTVGAAREAALMKVTGCAISLISRTGNNYDRAAGISRKIIKWILKNKLLKGFLLNINIPDLPLSEIKGISITRIGTKVYQDKITKRVDPYGLPYYWLKGKLLNSRNSPDTDIEAVKNKYISITPLTLDSTDYSQIENLKTLFRSSEFKIRF